LTMVRLATLTAKRRSTSPHRSTQRQRMTLWIAGSGPSIFAHAPLRGGESPRLE
jgi:hypothetical protein